MPATNTPATGFTVDENTFTLRFVREVDASPEDAFAAWTDSEQVAVWWDATGERLQACEIDPHPGGAFRFVTGHHPDKPFTGTYLEVSPPGRLVFDANGAIGTVTLAPREGGTRMSVEIVCSSAEHLRQFVAMGVANGTSQTLDNLVEHVGSPGAH